MLLGAHDRATGELLYLGDVGTGCTEQALRDPHARLASLARPGHPFAVEPAREFTGMRTRTDRKLRHAA